MKLCSMFALIGFVAALAACHDHPVPDDASPPVISCVTEAGVPFPYSCMTAGYCVDRWYFANTPSAGYCGTDGTCKWDTPTSLTECPCGCNELAGRCGNCGSTAY